MHSFKDIFWSISEEDISVSMENGDDESPPYSGTDDEDVMYRGDGSDDGDSPPATPSMEAGRRSPHWYNRIGQATQQNRKRSVENQKLLHRLDYRTVWIARLIIGLLITIIGGGIIELFFT